MDETTNLYHSFVHFRLRRQDSICIFADGENFGIHQYLHWWQQCSTGALLCYGFESTPSYKNEKKNDHPMDGHFLFWHVAPKKISRLKLTQNAYLSIVSSCTVKCISFNISHHRIISPSMSYQ